MTMIYNYNNKAYNIPDEEIDKAVEKLDCSIAEACEMYLTDHDLIKDETVEKLTKNATKNRITSTIHGAKGEKKPRKAREKKENPLKKQIISIIADAIEANYDVFDAEIVQFNVKNVEKYIDLTINDREFTINLVEHRKKKG